MHVREHRKGRWSDFVDRSTLCSGVNLHKCDTMEERQNRAQNCRRESRTENSSWNILVNARVLMGLAGTRFEDAEWIQAA
jgi:hypothetical protein